jgi:hypothetical protein
MPFCCLDNDPDGTNESCGFGVVNYENGRKMIYIRKKRQTGLEETGLENAVLFGWECIQSGFKVDK